MALEGAARERTGLARDLQSVQRDLHRGVGAVKFGHRGLSREGPAMAPPPSAGIGEKTGRFETSSTVGKAKVVALPVASPPTEGAYPVDRPRGEAQRPP